MTVKTERTMDELAAKADPVTGSKYDKNCHLAEILKLHGRETPWPSIWTATAMLLFTSIQISVYWTSTWPYISQAIPGASMTLFGYIAAASSCGCAVANPIYGYWNQKTLSTRNPLTLGLILCSIGNILYGLLPLFSPEVSSVVALVSRFLTGFGAGTLGLLRSFISTASTLKDRVRAVSMGTGGLTTGFAIGPVLQICFIPLGEKGIQFGPIVVNMYTALSFFMGITSILAILFVRYVLVEDYAGIFSDEEKKGDTSFVMPKFDRVAVLVLFFFWVLQNGAMATEGLATPITMVMYNWSSEEGVFYNGIFMTISCICSTFAYAVIGNTRIATWDKRKIMIVGMVMFLIYHIFHYPLPFYDGPLDRPVKVNGTVPDGAGGCLYHYDWCEETPRVPLPLFTFGVSIFLGFAYPLYSAPTNTILSEVLGPRKQGFMQGVYACTGNVAQLIVPIGAAYLFNHSGYKYIMLFQIIMFSIGIVLWSVFYKRLVPLKMQPTAGKAVRYKKGWFTRF